METDGLVLSLIFSGLRLATPLLFAALGGLLSERAGVANIALEGFLLIGGFFSAGLSYTLSSTALGLLGGIVAGGIIAALFAFLTIYARGDHIVMGTALNLFVMGCLPILSKTWFGSSGSTPSLKLQMRLNVWWFFVGALVLACLIHFGLKRTRFGLRLRACGENIEASRSLGVSVTKTRFWAVVLSGMIAALGGAFLSIAHGSQFTRGMSAGRGFIALAALILSGWRPIPAILTCLVFGLADAAQILLQSFELPGGGTVPVQFIQMFPYVITLIVLVGLVGRTSAPGAIGKNTD